MEIRLCSGQFSGLNGAFRLRLLHNGAAPKMHVQRAWVISTQVKLAPSVTDMFPYLINNDYCMFQGEEGVVTGTINSNKGDKATSSTST
jgi:hypothetical protein